MKKTYPCGFSYDEESSILSWQDPSGALERHIEVGHLEEEKWRYEKLPLNYGDRSSILIRLNTSKNIVIRGRALFKTTGWNEWSPNEII